MASPTGTFHGLFVGINRYKSTDVQNLAAAVRDAQALHALFTDNLQGDTTLVTDAEATSDRLRDELRRLARASSSDDFVVISFSGHGSDSHGLVTYEADRNSIRTTTLPLDEFTNLISAIPARHLLVVLDCCFSGGAGAKVLNAVAHSRGSVGGLPLSTEAFLAQMVGTGRVLLTASTADQEAYEDLRMGHGYLTYYLIRALMGQAAQTPAASINLLEVLQYVARQVMAGVSGTYAARQEPTVRGQWDGEVVWPTFVRGALYDALFPPMSPPPVTENLSSLSAYRIPDAIIEAWRVGIGKLNRLQQDAINTTGLFRGGNVVVTAPTSSGKTMVGEMAALKATQSGGRSVFLLPTKALVNEQYERFARTYGGCGVRVVRATGDYRDEVDAVLRGKFDLGLFTYEKFNGLALSNPHLLQTLSVVVVDEVQTIVDPERGRDLELLLTLMRSRRDEGVEPQLVTLSAVLGALNGLDTWLGADLLQSDVRPVDLEEGILTLDGTYRYLDPDRTEQTLQLMPGLYGQARARTVLFPLVNQLVAEGQQILVVRGIRSKARDAAEYLANALKLGPADRVLDALQGGDPTQSSTALRRCLEGGVAFHISDLAADQRRLIEEEFRRPDSQIRVVVATTTLAQGVNLPAETVIMPELSRFRGRGRGEAWYTVAEYKNIAGRAGRLGLSDKGRAIVLSFDGATYSTIWNRYINGTPEAVTSQLLNPDVDLQTVVLRVTALAVQRSPAGSVAVGDVIDILANSLGAHQARLQTGGDPFEATMLGAIVRELQDVGFLKATTPDQIKVTSLGELVASSMLTVSSAVRVASELRRVPPSLLNLPTLLAITQISEELDRTMLTVNTRRVGMELATFLNGLRSRGVVDQAIDAFSIPAANRVAIAARAKKAMAAILWVNGHPMGQIETQVMRHNRNRNASGPIAQVVSRTRDVIETVLAMATEIYPTLVLDAECTNLPLRLDLGIPHSCVPLALAGADLRREEYCALADGGLLRAGPEHLREVGDDVLLDLLGGDTDRLARLRRATLAVAAETEVPDLDDLMPQAATE